MWESNTLTSHLEKIAHANKDKIAYIYLSDEDNEVKKITYSELIVAAKKVAAFISHHNLSEKNILLCYSTGIDFIISFFGCLYGKAKAIIAPYVKGNSIINNKNIIKYILDSIDIQMIFSDADANKALDLHGLDVEQIFNTSLPITRDNTITSATLTHMLLTSGSTSNPKIVAFDHRCLLHNLHYTSASWHTSIQSIHLTWSNAFHSAGLMVGYLLPIFSGGTGIIFPMEAFHAQPLLFPQLISRYKVSHTACPNFSFDYLNLYIKTNNLDITKLNINLTSWQFALVGGDPLDTKTLHEFSSLFKQYGFRPDIFHTAYGMTEATGLIATMADRSPTIVSFKLSDIATNTLTDLVKSSIVENIDVSSLSSFSAKMGTLVSCGTSYAGVDTIVVDPLDPARILSDNEIGDVYFTSPSLMKGYWSSQLRQIEDSSACLSKHKNTKYFSTDDRGFINQNELFILGRKSEMICKGDKIFYPLFIELIAIQAYKKLTTRSNVSFMVNINGIDTIILVQELQERLVDETVTIEKAIHQALLNNYDLVLDKIIFIKDGSLPKIAGSGKLQRNLCKMQYLTNQLNVWSKTYHVENIIA